MELNIYHPTENDYLLIMNEAYSINKQTDNTLLLDIPAHLGGLYTAHQIHCNRIYRTNVRKINSDKFPGDIDGEVIYCNSISELNETPEITRLNASVVEIFNLMEYYNEKVDGLQQLLDLITNESAKIELKEKLDLAKYYDGYVTILNFVRLNTVKHYIEEELKKQTNNSS